MKSNMLKAFTLLCFVLAFTGCKERANKLCLALGLPGCKDRETQYTYYDKANSKPKEVFEVDKETGKKDGKYTLFTKDGSVKLVCSFEEGFVEDVHKSTMTDSRDGKTYKTVKICSQTWMAENLNYESVNSYCYKDNPEKCWEYGRLYTWAAAKRACPAGWHLPSSQEWYVLIAFTGFSKTGLNRLSFSALPAGGRNNGGYYYGEGLSAYFWSSTEANSYYAYHVDLRYVDDHAYLDSYDKIHGFSVRCLKD